MRKAGALSVGSREGLRRVTYPTFPFHTGLITRWGILVTRGP